MNLRAALYWKNIHVHILSVINANSWVVRQILSWMSKPRCPLRRGVDGCGATPLQMQHQKQAQDPNKSPILLL